MEPTSSASLLTKTKYDMAETGFIVLLRQYAPASTRPL